MVDKKWLTPADRARQTFPTLEGGPRTEGGIPGDDRDHIYNLARAELEARASPRTEINTQGLTVATTVDAAAQQQAADAVIKAMEGQPDNLRSRWCRSTRRPARSRLLRRQERPGHRLRPGAAPARLVVQAVRAGRRAAGRQDPNGARARLTYDGSSPADAGRHEGDQLRGLRLRRVHGQDGHDQVDQHHLLQDGPGRRPAAGGRRRAPGRDPGRPAARPDRRHLAGRPGGAPDGHGLGLRHVRRRR